MHGKRPPVPVIVIILIILLVGGYYGLQALFDETNGTLQASGTIEAVEISLSPEMAGKVAEVLVNEGDSITADSLLLSLDDSLLSAQRSAAAAQVDSANATAVTADRALASAQTRYNQTLQTALMEEQAIQARDWRYSAPDEFNQSAWYFNQAEQLTSAQAEVDAAKAAYEEALANLDKVVNDIDNAGFIEAENRLADARAAFLVADDVKIQAEYAPEGGGLLDAAYDAYDLAKDELDDAQREYNDLLTSQSREDVENARGQVVVAQQRYDTAVSRLLALQTGVESPSVVTAQNMLDQTKAAADQARTSISQAEANLALLDTQMTRLSVYAPAGGTILTRNVEPGEFVQPGATVFTLANLEQLTITVYVPEDRYGEISLGQQAEVKVDSFPGETFSAQVTFISDTAEYTPRNVQTVEGRSATVYAIKLKVDDPNGMLKPGMPADVIFR
jgi:HlyD family secretion protein